MKKLFFILLTSSTCQLLFAANFICEQKVEENSLYLHCLNKVETYPKLVHFYYPKNLNENKVKVNIHFHGHNISGWDHFKRTLNFGEGYGDYGAFLVQSKFNGILIVPESDGRNTTYESLFSNESLGKIILNDLLGVNNFLYSNLSFSGHSGAYRVLRTIFNYENLESTLKLTISGIGLFDATYGQIDSIEKFAFEKKISKQDFIFFDTYVAGKFATTETISNSLKEKYKKDSNYYFFPMNFLKGEQLEQHFEVLKNPGLKTFLELLK